MTNSFLSKFFNNFEGFGNKNPNLMNVLILGSGGREHCLAWKLKKSPLINQIYIAPGNAGTLQYGVNLPIKLNDFEAIQKAALQFKIDMVVVGPEDPLVNGIYDVLKKNSKTSHIKIIGPSQHSAKLEGSKAFAKEFMMKYNIPTANYKEFTIQNFEEGLVYLKAQSLPIVLKADGLAGGKGVVICDNLLEATTEYEMMIKQGKFGEAGNKVVVESFLRGIEFSVFALTDGKSYKILPIAKDYKKVGEKETGLNTGGMGAISPVPFVDQEMMQKVEEKIIKPTITGLHTEGMIYEGIVFFGLISVDKEPYVIEYNCRLGDPETEVVLPRLKNDLAEVFKKLIEGNLAEVEIEEDQRAAAAIVATSGGYPGFYKTGYTIEGLNELQEETLFIAGAQKETDNVKTTGGRVLVATSLADSLTGAVAKSKVLLSKVDFEDMYFRNDIGFEFMQDN